MHSSEPQFLSPFPGADDGATVTLPPHRVVVRNA